MNNILCAPRMIFRIHPWRADNSHMNSFPHARALYPAIRVLFFLLVLAFPLGNLLHPSFTLAQSDGTGLQQPISVTSELVALPVNVADSNGNFIPGLSRKNFRVYEDNLPQRIASFEQEDTPASISVVVDHSGSMETKLSNVITAISAFARLSNPKDEISVVNFADTVSVEPMGGKLFTSDPAEIEKAIEAVSAEGRTALYDAVAAGILHLQRGHWQKRVLIIISDGGDNASCYKYPQIVALARQSQVTIYAVGLVDESGDEQNPKALERLSKETGGIAFFPNSPDAVVGSAVRIAGNLRQRYMLGYVPENRPAGESYRKIRVSVVAADKGTIRARTRPGYSVTPQPLR